MDFEIGKILFHETAEPKPMIEVSVRFTENDKSHRRQSGNVTVYVEMKDYTVSELKAEAMKAAKELLSKAAE